MTQNGAKNSNWKGGRTLASSGYYLVKMVGHPMADARGYVYEHRLVASQILGRPLEKREVVHHRNGIKTDNRPENLEIMPSIAAHRAHHRAEASRQRNPGEGNPIVACACGCGQQFVKFDSFGRPRLFVTGHNMNVR